MVAEAAQTTVTTVQRWRRPQSKGGTGGFIPRKYHDRLISFGLVRGVQLTAASFVDLTEMETRQPAPSSTEAA